MASPPRKILITSATGHQGSALIRALLSSPTSGSAYHIYAVTRSTTSPKAVALAALSPTTISVVAGNLDDRASIAQIFADAASSGSGIWGVFAVLPFPGLGVSDEGEEAQGKVSFASRGRFLLRGNEQWLMSTVGGVDAGGTSAGE